MHSRSDNCHAGKAKIPKSLLLHMVSLLEELDIEDYPPDVIRLYGYVLFSLKTKKAILEARLHRDMRCDFMPCDDEVPF